MNKFLATFLVATLTAVVACDALAITRKDADVRVVCTDSAGNVTLQTDGRTRLAYWHRDQPMFTRDRVSARHVSTFPAPRGSVCRVQ